MKRLILWGLCALLCVQMKAQQVEGKVIDEQGAALEYVNVVAYQLADSAFVQGAVTDAEGIFSFPLPGGQAFRLRFSSIGYRDTTLIARAGTVGSVMLQTDTQMLGEVTVKGNRPTHRPTTEGVATEVDHTVLAKAGTADDVLQRIPGIAKKKDGYEVIGKGAPAIYINNRLMRDASELDNLSSEQIKSVEVITAPGARYDATVKSVIRIKTKRTEGEGFGFDLRSSYNQSEYASFTEQLDYNYRHNNLDIFGTVKYDKIGYKDHNTLQQVVDVDTLWRQNNIQTTETTSRAFRNITGFNLSIGENHSIGAKYTLMLAPKERSVGTFIADITANGAYYDHMDNELENKTTYKPDHQLNAYYNGTVGQTQIDFNIDFLSNEKSVRGYNNERSREGADRVVTSTNNVKNRMLAARLVMESALWGGNLTYGGEYAGTTRQDNYISHEQVVPTSYSKRREWNVAPFVEYTHPLPFGSLSAGLRFEHVATDLYDGDRRIDSECHTFNNLFPNLSLTAQVGGVNLQVGYNAKTVRPSYYDLRNGTTYANRFTMQKGNPNLKSQTVHTVSLSALWRFLQLTASYEDNRHVISDWSEQQQENPAITLYVMKNFNSLQTASAFLTASPRVGVWSPQLTVGVIKQWFAFDTATRRMHMNKPIYIASLYNGFNFGKGWTASADLQFTGKGESKNVELVAPTYILNASVSKSMLDDRLTIQLQGHDLLHDSQPEVNAVMHQTNVYQHNSFTSRYVGITARYRFNAAKNKYKGTGAGAGEKQRM